jgi:hypothetical protein
LKSADKWQREYASAKETWERVFEESGERERGLKEERGRDMERIAEFEVLGGVDGVGSSSGSNGSKRGIEDND